MENNDLLLKDFKPISALQLEEHIPERAKFPVIDAHNHLGYHDFIRLPFYYGQSGWLMPDVQKGIALMDELNIRVVVNLDGAFGDQTKKNLRTI